MRHIQPTEHPYKSILAYNFSTDDKLDFSKSSKKKSKVSETSSNEKVEIKLLGSPQILVEGEEIPLRSPRSFALIAYLCLELSPTPRNNIAELLWTAEEQPTNDRLRVLLSKLRRIAPDLILSSTKKLAINPTIRERTDAIQFLALHDQNTIPAYKKAIECYTGDFLAGLELSASGEFEKWLEHQQTIWREILNFMYQQVVDDLLSNTHGENELREALFLAHKHTSIFPWSDEMVFRLAIIYVKKRQPDRAMSVLNNYEQRIQKEFDVSLPDELASIKHNLVSAQIDQIIQSYPEYF